VGQQPEQVSGVLLDRRNECQLLDPLIADVWSGESRALVVRAEAGVGPEVPDLAGLAELPIAGLPDDDARLLVPKQDLRQAADHVTTATAPPTAPPPNDGLRTDAESDHGTPAWRLGVCRPAWARGSALGRPPRERSLHLTVPTRPYGNDSAARRR
jgi:hypothetical protein